MLFNSISPPFYPKDIKKSVSNHLAGLLTYSSFCALPSPPPNLPAREKCEPVDLSIAKRCC